MLLYSTPEKIYMKKNMDIKSVHTLILPTDISCIKEINSNIRTLKPYNSVFVHYEYGFYIVSKNGDRFTTKYTIRIAYKKEGNKQDIQYRTFKTNDLFEILNATRDFLTGNYLYYLNLGLN